MPYEERKNVGNVMDCRPVGWHERIHQTEWRVYGEHRVGAERCSCDGGHLCSGKKGSLFCSRTGRGGSNYQASTLLADLRWQNWKSRLPVCPELSERDNFVVVASRSHLTPETEAYIEEIKRQAWQGRPVVEWQFHQDMSGSRGESGRVSSFCSYNGMGYGSRTCHSPRGRYGGVSCGRPVSLCVIIKRTC